MPAAVPDRDDAAVRTAADSFGCLYVQNQARPGRGDSADVDAFDTKQRVYRSHPRPGRKQDWAYRVSFLFGSLVATNSKRP